MKLLRATRPALQGSAARATVLKATVWAAILPVWGGRWRLNGWG